MNEIKVRILLLAGGLPDARIPLYGVEITTEGEDGAIWEETFGNLDSLNAFITGMKCASSFAGKLPSFLFLPIYSDMRSHLRMPAEGEDPIQLWPERVDAEESV